MSPYCLSVAVSVQLPFDAACNLMLHAENQLFSSDTRQKLHSDIRQNSTPQDNLQMLQKMGTAIGVAAKAHKAKTAAAFIVGSAPEQAAGRITQGAMLSAYEAVRFKKAQPKLTGGSWTSLEQLQVLLPEGADMAQAQQSVDRSCAMAKGAIVTR